MKRNLTYLFLLPCLVLLATGCTKAPKGYLSSYIYYNQYLEVVPRGLPYAGLNNNIIDGGSTPPYFVKMTHVYDSAGNVVDSVMFKKYTITQWTSAYNFLVDTTLQLVNSIQKQVDTFPIGLNSAGGRLETNAGTSNLPLGTYTFDMQVTNAAGTKTYPKVGSFQLVDPPVYSLSSIYEYLKYPQSTNTKATGVTPVVTLTTINSDPTQRTIIMKVVDKNGTPFNPAAGELGHYAIPSGATFYPSLKNFSVGATNTDSTIVYQFATTPFPYYLASGIYTSNGTQAYFTVQAPALNFDNQTPQAYNALIEFLVNVNVNGTYLLTIQLQDATHS